jgi:hypothetical protein
MALLLAGCAARTDSLQPFASDGCSMFPDRAPIGNADWCACCLAHDIAYWKGGTEQDRLAADQALEQCVQHTTQDPVLAASMLAGVRVGGTPYLDTPFRWAYGWKDGRTYQPLTADESALALRLEAEYQAKHEDVCRL